MSMTDPTATQFGDLATGNPGGGNPGLGPKDFAADGAVGAGGAGAIPDTQSTGSSSTPAADTQSTGAADAPAPPAAAAKDAYQIGIDYANHAPGNYSTGADGQMTETPFTAGQVEYQNAWNGGAGGTPEAGSYTGGGGPNSTFTPMSAADKAYATAHPAMMMADGGAVGEDDQNAVPGQGDGGLQQSINQALETVDNALSYGRKLHGLPDGNGAIPDQQAANMPTIPGNQSETPGPYKPGGGQKQAAAMPTIPGNQSETPGPYKPGGGQKQAANMPTIPGSQSESGIPPLQPAPGRLPPTSNPFGKRADAGDSDGDEGQGAIPDNDQDEAA